MTVLLLIAILGLLFEVWRGMRDNKHRRSTDRPERRQTYKEAA